MKFLILVFVLTISTLVTGISEDKIVVGRKFISEGKCSGVMDQLKGGWNKVMYCCDEDAPVIPYPEISAIDTRTSDTILEENKNMLTQGRTNCQLQASGIL